MDWLEPCAIVSGVIVGAAIAYWAQTTANQTHKANLKRITRSLNLLAGSLLVTLILLALLLMLGLALSGGIL